MEFANVVNNCHDCGKVIDIQGKDIKNGFMITYKDNGKTIKIFKCQECFKNNPALTNFRRCEVYSRVVGYIRPVRQWHVGKKQEFKERDEFKMQEISYM